MTETKGKIEYIEPHKEAEVNGILEPLVREWFFSRFKEFSKTQLYGVKNIYDRKNILITVSANYGNS